MFISERDIIFKPESIEVDEPAVDAEDADNGDKKKKKKKKKAGEEVKLYPNHKY